MFQCKSVWWLIWVLTTPTLIGTKRTMKDLMLTTLRTVVMWSLYPTILHAVCTCYPYFIKNNLLLSLLLCFYFPNSEKASFSFFTMMFLKILDFLGLIYRTCFNSIRFHLISSPNFQPKFPAQIGVRWIFHPIDYWKLYQALFYYVFLF